MVKESTKNRQESRDNFLAKFKKGYHAIKKTDEKTECTISLHRKCMKKIETGES